MSEFPVLYDIAKNGKERQWSVRVIGGGNGAYTIVKESGFVGGKMIVHERKVTEGKNKGKRNETTAQEQATLEARSAWEKQKKTGYNEIGCSAQKRFLPMLALNGSGIDRSSLPESVYVQPKIDGVRVAATWNDGRVCLTSRTGEEVCIPHIERACQSYVSEEVWFDGEVFSDELSFQELCSLFLCKERSDEQNEKLATVKFHVFDAIFAKAPAMAFHDRYKSLASLPFGGSVVLVETSWVPKQDIDFHHTRYTEIGYEGVMVRLASSVYEPGKRSRGLMKIKHMQDSEFRVVGAASGCGKDSGCAIWRCKTSKGVEFHVRPKGSVQARKCMYENRERFIGKLLTVQYQNLTEDGVPRFPVGVGFRPDA